ncbi:hypothetical protein ACEU6E_00355 [Halorutilales archaeon Cl-col2-1]
MDSPTNRRRFLASVGVLALAGCVQATDQQNGNQTDGGGDSENGSGGGSEGGDSGNDNAGDTSQNETQNETANETAEVEEEVDYVSEPRRDRRVSLVRDSVMVQHGGGTSGDVIGEVENTGNVPLMGSDVEIVGNMIDNDGIEILRGETNPEDVYFEPGETLPFKFTVSEKSGVIDSQRIRETIKERLEAAEQLSKFGQRIADNLHLEANVVSKSEIDIPIPRRHFGADVLELLEGEIVEVNTSVTSEGSILPEFGEPKFELRLNNLSGMEIRNLGVMMILRKSGSTPHVVSFIINSYTIEADSRGTQRRVEDVNMNSGTTLNNVPVSEVGDPEIRITLYENTEIVAADAE